MVNRYGDSVKINIESGRFDIELEENLFKIKGRQRLVNEMAPINDTCNTLVRRLLVSGTRDLLLIYGDDLFLLAVKEAYDAVDIRIVD